MENSIGSIDGKQLIRTSEPQIIEQEPGHFIVISDSMISEIFLTSGDLLSDGNTLDGVEVSLETEKERIIRTRFGDIQKKSSPASSKGMILKASMPGMVKSVSIRIGDKVQKNTQALVLEAMKMENSIMAGFTGIVTKILVEPGMSVEKNMQLVVFSAVE